MTTTENKPQILAFGPRGLANISIAMDNSGKSPAVVDTNNHHDHYDSFDIQNGHVKDYVLDWLAIYVPKTITICLTYGVQLMLIILGSIYVTDCYAAPELPIMAIIVGAGYAVCWVVYRNTETGKLPQIVKSACYTGTACAFIVLLVGLVRAMCIFTYWRSCSNVLIAPVATFAMIVLAIVIKLKLIDPAAKVLKSRKTYTGAFY